MQQQTGKLMMSTITTIALVVLSSAVAATATNLRSRRYPPGQDADGWLCRSGWTRFGDRFHQHCYKRLSRFHACSTGSGSACQTCKAEADRTNSNHCTACNTGYVLSGTVCKATTSDVHACETGDESACATCEDQSQRKTSNHCATCNSGYVLSGTECLLGDGSRPAWKGPDYERGTYDDAKAKCAALGAYLAVPSSAAENTFLAGILMNPHGRSTWLGYDHTASTNWADGRTPASNASDANGWRLLGPTIFGWDMKDGTKPVLNLETDGVWSMTARTGDMDALCEKSV